MLLFIVMMERGINQEYSREIRPELIYKVNGNKNIPGRVPAGLVSESANF